VQNRRIWNIIGKNLFVITL
jgi:hypothetical protein